MLNDKITNELSARFREIEASTSTPTILATVQVLKSALALCVAANPCEVDGRRVLELEGALRILWEITREPVG